MRNHVWVRTGLLVITITLAPSCGGFLGEREAPAPTVQTASSNQSCSLPRADDLKSVLFNPLQLSQAADCLNSQLDEGFKSVRGGVEDELSVSELKQLVQRRVIALDFQDERKWGALEGALRLFHPNGRPALHRGSVQQLLKWAKSHSEIFLRIKNTKAEDLLKVSYDEILPAVEELREFMSSDAVLTRDWFLHVSKMTGMMREDAAKAVWSLRLLLLADPTASGDEGQVVGSSIKSLLTLAIDVAKEARNLVQWYERNEAPSNLRDLHRSEAKAVSNRIRRYFKAAPFSSISSTILQLSLERLMPGTGIAELAPDLVRLTQRLGKDEPPKSGLHPYGLLALTDQFPDLIKDVTTAATFYQSCPSIKNCARPLRNVMENPFLSRVALKTPLEATYYDPVEKKMKMRHSRGEISIQFKAIMDTLAVRRILHRIFATLDSDGNGLINYTETSIKSAQEGFDFAYTFLRFATALGSAVDDSEGSVDSTKQLKSEQRVLIPLTMKPSAIYNVAGIIGDQWLADGDGDGQLNADEFFSVLSTYLEVERLSKKLVTEAAASTRPDRPKLYQIVQEAGELSTNATRPLFCRTDFAKKMHWGFENELPWIYDAFEKLSEEKRTELGHGLAPKTDFALKVVEVEAGVPGKEAKVLYQYADYESAMGTAALGLLMDRLWLTCDGDESLTLNTRQEIDCARVRIAKMTRAILDTNLMDVGRKLAQKIEKYSEKLEKDATFISWLAEEIMSEGTPVVGIRKKEISMRSMIQAIALIPFREEKLSEYDSCFEDPRSGLIRTHK